jgi:uncharacterized protein (TIGR02996 family)
MARKRKLEASPTADRAEMRRLLEAAKADHWDDGPRLVMADWLEEHGGEADKARAEVIRLQMDSANGGPSWTRSIARLRVKHVREWVGTQREFFKARPPWVDRGLFQAEVAAERYSAGKPDASWDWVETARVSVGKPEALRRLLGSPRMATVPRLGFGEKPVGGAVLRQLAGSGVRSLQLWARGRDFPELARAMPPGLNELEVAAEAREYPDDWAALFSGDGAGLTYLRVGISDLGDDAAAGMAASPRLAGLRRLSLADSQLSDAGLASLARLRLEHLDISGGTIGLAGLARLADRPCRVTLQSLRLFFGHSRDWGGRLPVGFTLPALRQLEIRRCDLSSQGLAELARGPLLGGLEVLDLSLNEFGDEGLRAITEARWTAPRALILDACELGDAGVKRLAAWPGLEQVRRLSIRHNAVGNAGLKALASSPYAGSLEALDVGRNVPASAAGMKAFLRSAAAARLRWLSIHNSCSETLARAVAEHAPPTLRELRLGEENIRYLGAAAMARLRARLPGCAIG